jgi:integrase
LSVFKRGSVYWYDFWFKGRRVRETTRLTNKTAALRLEAVKKADLAQGRVQRECPAFETFVKEEFLPWSKVQHRKWSTHKRYCVSAKPLVKFFKGRMLDDILTADIERFKVERLSQCSAAGVNRDLSALRFMLNFAVRQGYLRSSPFIGVKLLQEGPGMMRVVSSEEEMLYLAHATPLLRDIAVLILQTGMRPQEVFSIRGENVNLQDRFVFVPEGKSRFARRTIPLTDEARKVLKSRMRDGYLFPHRDDPVLPMTACRSHDTVMRKLKLGFRLYDLRHTFGSRAAMAGVDLPTLKELMGHSHISLTMRYIHPTPQHKKEAIAKLAEFNRRPHKSPHSGPDQGSKNGSGGPS